MSANPIDSNNTDKPTGSLEDLFRHHLSEAAVPPRPMLWDQIDNSLLVQQNAIYRRRLMVTRWVAAASITIASLAGTGWWATRDAMEHSRADLAAATHQVEAGSAMRNGINGSAINSPNSSVGAIGTNGAAGATGQAVETAAAQSGTTYAANTNAQVTDSQIAARINGGSSNSVAALPGEDKSSAIGRQNAGNMGRFSQSAQGLARAASVTGKEMGNHTHFHQVDNSVMQPIAAIIGNTPAGSSARSAANTGTIGMANAGLATYATTDAIAAKMAATKAPLNTAALAANNSSTAIANDASASDLSLATSTSAEQSAEQIARLNSRAAALRLAAAAALPAGFATVAVPADGTPPAAAPVRKWQFGASYTAGVFNPNINFSRTGGAADFDYNPALGPNSAALTETAAAEYRANLRSGSSQRLAVRATRRLSTRWALSTGVEYNQNRASSASSLAFVGEQVPDFGQSAGGPMRTTNFRYRTAGLPVEVRYTAPVKQGLSLYGRVGAVVTALLGVRAEVDGIPEATRTYSITAEGPYRRMLANVRGGVGAQFRPANGNWSASLGPVMEMGLLSLNAHPAQGLTKQSRAYSLGLEAGVEFGRSAK